MKRSHVSYLVPQGLCDRLTQVNNLASGKILPFSTFFLLITTRGQVFLLYNQNYGRMENQEIEIRNTESATGTGTGTGIGQINECFK